MLRSIHIENIAVIRRADLELRHGFSALTGETGAGKSMIIDSINLLLGNRVSKEIIRSGESYALVNAVFEDLSPALISTLEEIGFDCEDGSLILQRKLFSDGRSQARLNGQIITQSLQKEISRMLISIHGQSDNQKLLQKSAHRELLDLYAGTESEKEAYRRAFFEWKTCRDRLEKLSRDDAEKLRRCEMLKYQIEDINAMKLSSPDEEERLEKERDRLLNAEKIDRQIKLSYRALRGGEKTSAYDLVRRSQNAIRTLSGLVDGVEELSERLDFAAAEIEDVAELLLSYDAEDGGDPTARIDAIESRLEGISKLKRKYGNSIQEILAFRARAEEQLEELEGTEEARADLEKQEALLTKEASALAAVLTEKRRVAAKTLSNEILDTLRFLDMPKIRFEISVLTVPLSENGADDVEFLIAANPGEPLLPMIKIASGGELSRIMLALRSVLNDHDGASTVIFDEIDTGVSGKTSRKIGIKLSETARKTQVLCVTHSAQIASLADTHYRIVKNEREGRAETEVLCLERNERIEEIARILGGIEITAAVRDAAREMIDEYKTEQ